jgi:lipopolysaccharide transport system ATP-binding protein
MLESAAIVLEDVSKIYRLYGSQREQLLDVLGLRRFLRASAAGGKEFKALDRVSLRIPRGARYAIVGRNGAGKTTLLKLISGNFAPTSGRVVVSGTIQALMGTGFGFHVDYTGRENIESSLQYNGLPTAQFSAAAEEIIDFCELGEFIDQPFKTYSMGMQARLMFATATAIRPEILIVDEVLGAGDGYFLAKSKRRIERLVSSGCTLLLVSHSTQQVLELCERAIWLDRGKVRMEAEAFEVVKAYEEDLFGGGSIRADAGDFPKRHDVTRIPENTVRTGGEPNSPSNRSLEDIRKRVDLISLQQPIFAPHAIAAVVLRASDDDWRELRFVAPGGVSRWTGEDTLKVVGFSISGPRGVTERLISLEPACFTLFVQAAVAGSFDCVYGYVIQDPMGTVTTRLISQPDRFAVSVGDVRRIDLTLNPNQLGPGEYTVGIAILATEPLEALNNARRYDLVSRSFRFTVELPGRLGAVSCQVFHSGEWVFRTMPKGGDPTSSGRPC